jgi:hypothetical protein
MTTIETVTTTVELPTDDFVDDAQLTAVAILARYRGRTLDALPAGPPRVLPVDDRS